MRRGKAQGATRPKGLSGQSRQAAHKRARDGLRCEHHPACPGCSLLGLPYREQLELKRRAVESALYEFPELAGVEVPPVNPAPKIAGYRIQSKLVVSPGKDGPLLGLYRRGTHVVTDIRDCPMHHPLVGEALNRLAQALAEADIPIHDPARGATGVRYALIRASAWERKVVVTLVSSAMPLSRIGELVWRLRLALPLASLYLNVNRTSGNVILGPESIRMWGAESLSERYGRLLLAAGPTSFVQANPAQAGRIYRIIAQKAALSAASAAVDLYCGVGGISLALAACGAPVTGIEEVPEAVKFAKLNASANGITSARFVCAQVERRLTEPLLRAAEVVTANPPRKGLGEQVLSRLSACAARRLLYLSCWPPSFARDAAALAQAGFGLREIHLFDMMPQTDHVEILGVFRRRGTGANRPPAG